MTLLEAGRDLTRVWLHVDMDAFYASVEELEQPALRDKPMAVGGLGMICTANYQARKYGVRNAMPGFIARKLCPQLVFVKPDFSKYAAASEATRAVFRQYDASFEAGSLDEAYLDVTQHCSSTGMTGQQVAAELRARVTEATRLTCSVGVAPNSLLAKIASDLHKPNGQAVVGATREAVLGFMRDLHVRKVPGIGKVSEQTLAALGITTCGQLLQQRALLAALFKPASSSFFLQVGLGLGQTRHAAPAGGPDSSEPGRKGISCERTFAAMKDPQEMERMAESLVQHLAADMAEEGIEGKTLTLKIKTTEFEVRTRAATLTSFVSTPVQMLPHILRLLRAELPELELRLMGVRASSLRKRAAGAFGSGGGGRLNALQRMLLQGQEQQQQQQGKGSNGEEDVVMVTDAEAEEGQQQPQQGRGQQQLEQQEAGQQSGGWSGCSSRVCCSFTAEGSSCDVLAAGSCLEAGLDQQQHQQQAGEEREVQSQQVQQQQWQQWQQLGGQQPIAARAAMEQLHQGLQQQQQQQRGQGQQGDAGQGGQAVSAKRHRSSVPHGPASSPTLQQQHASEQQQRQQRQPEEDQEWLPRQPSPPPQQQPQRSGPHNLQQPPPHPSASKGHGGSSSWTCLACTFSGNKKLMLRCEVCDTPKGSSSPDHPVHARAAAPAGAVAVVSKAGKSSSSRGKGRGRAAAAAGGPRLAGSKRSGRQMTLEGMVAPAH